MKVQVQSSSELPGIQSGPGAFVTKNIKKHQTVTKTKNTRKCRVCHYDVAMITITTLMLSSRKI